MCNLFVFVNAIVVVVAQSRLSIFFFFLNIRYKEMRRAVVRIYWKHNVAEDMQVLLVMQEGKEAMFLCVWRPLSLVLHSSFCIGTVSISSPRISSFLHARVSFLE